MGPSDRACSGSSWISRNSASKPAATAAARQGATNWRLAAGAVPRPPGTLHAVGGVEHHRDSRTLRMTGGCACPPPGCCSRSWRRARSAGCAVAGGLRPSRRRSCMSQGAMNWPFLMLTARPLRAGRQQQVGLAAQEGRDLEDVDHLRPPARPRAASCTSVSTGHAVAWRLTSARISRPASRPGPR